MVPPVAFNRGTAWVLPRGRNVVQNPDLQAATVRLIARKTAERRALLGLRQKQLAAVCGVSTAMISKYESGASDIPAAQLWRLAAILGVPIDYFFDRQLIRAPHAPPSS